MPEIIRVERFVPGAVREAYHFLGCNFRKRVSLQDSVRPASPPLRLAGRFCNTILVTLRGRLKQVGRASESTLTCSRRKNVRRFSWFAVSLVLCAGSLCAQTNGSLPKFGLGLKVSTLGAGIEAATAVSRKSNLRVGFNYFTYSDTFTKDGIAYDGKLNLQSFEVHYDQYLIGGFHISPGVLLYDDNRGMASAAVPSAQSFTLGGTTYYSSASSPVVGNGTLGFQYKTAPELLIGFGNLLPRSKRHFGFNFEFGAAYQGSPSVALNLTGSACTSPGVNCQSIASTPAIQSNVTAQQTKINGDLKVFKYYPVVSLAFGYKF